MAEERDAKRLQILNAVLRVAVAHASLLQHDSFEALANAIREHLPVERVLLVVPDTPGYRRVYAIAREARRERLFGLRVPAVPTITRTVFTEARPHIVDDTRVGEGAERIGADNGILSFVALPLKVRDEPVLAEIVFGFAEVGVARRAPIDVLQEIADALAPSIRRALYSARERRLALIIETSTDAMLAWDSEGRITDANGAATSLTGRTREELIGAPIEELIGPLPRVGDGPPPAQGVRLDLVVRTPAGPRRTLVAATITAVDDDAQVAAHALLRDLSHVAAAEREAAAHLSRVHEIEEQHRTLLDNAPLIIFRLDPATGELVYLNLHAERLLGVPTREALATPGFLRAIHADPAGVAAFDEAVARAGAGDATRPYDARAYDARLRRRGGDEITARGTIYPLLSESGQVAAIEGVLADVSAEHAARTRLVQADRLSTMGMLAAGVAHEINNPAAFIVLGLDVFDRLLRGPGVALDDAASANAADLLRELRDSIRRIVDITRDLRLFASPPGHDGGRRALIDVNRTVESALSLTRGRIIERAQVERHLGEVPPVIMEDGRLGQVIVNLLVNAAQAMPKEFSRDNRIIVRTRSDGGAVEIEVTDTGSGIADDDLARIWQPFFTTKGPAEGTGLGLPISREIVERAGGRITVESPVFHPAVGSDSAAPFGARFVIHLPPAGVRAEVATPISTQIQRIPSARVRLLLVEDEPALARTLAEELRRLHEVVVVSNGASALEAMAKDVFDVVLCDLRMPGMSGEALYARVLEIDQAHARAFIFMTGVGFGADVERFVAASGRPLLEKPFSADQALDTIVRVVSRNRRR